MRICLPVAERNAQLQEKEEKKCGGMRNVVEGSYLTLVLEPETR